MKLLLDTHSLLWFITGDERCSLLARAAIADSANEVLISIASMWEIAIKVSLGKLTLASPFEQLFPQQLKANSINVMPITLDALAVVTRLPFHHRDPFDRLIAAQALVHEIPLLSADAAFDPYGVQRLWK